MPYPGIPDSKTKDMEACVEQVMGRGHSKDSAIAICHVSIMGDKKKPTSAKAMADEGGENMRPISINFYGDYWKKVNDEIDIEESNPIDKSTGNNLVEKSTRREVNEDMKKEDKELEVKKQSAQEEDGRQVAPNDSKKADEEKEEMDACMKEQTGKGKNEADARKACKKMMAEHETGESKEEEDKEEGKEKVEKTESKPAEVEQVTDVATLLKNVMEKIDKLVAKQDEEKPAEETPESAPAEGATPVEEAPKEEAAVEEAPKEEAPVEGASPEGTEVKKAVSDLTAKVDNTLLKITEKVDSLSKSIDEKFKDLATRVNKLEELEIPSKVRSTVIVSKSDNAEGLTAIEQEKLTQINKEIDELKAMQRDNIEKYQNGRYWDKAFSLIAARDILLAKKMNG